MPVETDRNKPRQPLQTGKEQRRHQIPISDVDRQDIEKLYTAFRRAKAKLVSPSGRARVLPDSLYAFLVELIGLLNEGKSVMIVQNQAKLTTIEAASMLGVSRQFLVNMLERGEIPYHMVGTHRRIYAQDLLHFKSQRDGQRRRVIDELSEAEARDGIYDNVPLNLDEE